MECNKQFVWSAFSLGNDKVKVGKGELKLLKVGTLGLAFCQRRQEELGGLEKMTVRSLP